MIVMNVVDLRSDCSMERNMNMLEEERKCENKKRKCYDQCN
jgi:hypothetical protein